MKIAITRLSGKERSDAERCRAFGHQCYSVHPLRSVIRDTVIHEFAESANRGDFDGIFFTSALPAAIIAPLIHNPPRVIAIGPTTASILRQHGVACETLDTYYSSGFVPFLGRWIAGKRIGIPRADVPNPALLDAIRSAGGVPAEFRCYELVPTGIPLDIAGADSLLFTSAMSFEKAVWSGRDDLIIMAIGDVTAGKMRKTGIVPCVVGDGSLEGTLSALNAYISDRESKKRGD
jgi:uroporphyrinogen-III synthase